MSDDFFVRIISLPEDNDRRTLFLQRNQSLLSSRKDFSFFDGIDGKKLDFSQPGWEAYIDPTCVAHYSAGAVGCALSHLRLWEECIEKQVHCCIFEDDAVLHPEFWRGITSIQDQLKGKEWDILLLSYNLDAPFVIETAAPSLLLSCSSHQKSITAETFCSSLLPPFLSLAKAKVAFGIAAYLVSPTGAKKLKDSVFPLKRVPLRHMPEILSCSVDCMMSLGYASDIVAYLSLSPLVMTEKGAKGYLSTIDPRA